MDYFIDPGRRGKYYQNRTDKTFDAYLTYNKFFLLFGKEKIGIVEEITEALDDFSEEPDHEAERCRDDDPDQS